MAAVDSGHHELVSWLLEKGANPNARTGFGSQATALHGAAWQGNMRMVETTGRRRRGRQRAWTWSTSTPSGFARVARESPTTRRVMPSPNTSRSWTQPRLADVAEAVGVPVVARVHARPARDFALQRLEFRAPGCGHTRRDFTRQVAREPDLDLQGERLGPRRAGLDAFDFVVARRCPRAWPRTSPPGRTGRDGRRGRCSSRPCRSIRGPARWCALRRGSSCGLPTRAQELFVAMLDARLQHLLGVLAERASMRAWPERLVVPTPSTFTPIFLSVFWKVGIAPKMPMDR